MIMIFQLFFHLLVCEVHTFPPDPIYEIKQGKITFHSTAPMELIRASSDKVRGSPGFQ
jgi:hypothetical protein